MIRPLTVDDIPAIAAAVADALQSGQRSGPGVAAPGEGAPWDDEAEHMDHTDTERSGASSSLLAAEQTGRLAMRRLLRGQQQSALSRARETKGKARR
jgi:hypothetical protein